MMELRVISILEVQQLQFNQASSLKLNGLDKEGSNFQLARRKLLQA
ncbi:NAD-binding 6-phosphogluconate dehydrogenase [Corchorus olitorius]|uniref:NAD-binding 6-phosphogluconate dehydrogenase n=1 Tax=Corchorus olitorius TaxID=93759 RepID=A0A1R3IYU3_9ROSI|nr:NAD-binding 6-phosphogluconate dehydrogenase [Corchorus olitorius]